MNDRDIKISEAKKLIEHARYVLIGGGSGLSSSAELDYSCARFKENFSDFISKYGVRDMYSVSLVIESLKKTC